MISFRYLCLLVTFVLLHYLVGFRPIDDLDLFTQMKFGQLSLEHFALITSEPFTNWSQTTVLWNPGWLAQIIFASLYKLGSWELLKFVANILLVLALVLPAYRSNLKEGGRSIFGACLAALIAFLVSGSNTSVRPQIISFFCFSIVELLVGSSLRTSKKILLVLIVSVFWQNCHTSLSIAAVLISCLITGQILKSFLGKTQSKNNLFELFLVLAIVLASQFLTPLGFDAIAVSKANLLVSKWLGISEWMPPWHSSLRSAMLPFNVAFCISLILIIRYWRQFDFTDCIKFIAFSSLTLYSSRFAVYWAIIMIPIWAQSIDIIKGSRYFNWDENNSVSPLKSLLIGFLALFLTIKLYFFSTLSPFDRKIPLACVKNLKELVPSGNIFNYREWAGPLVFFGSPNWRVHIDGRLYLYDLEYWNEYNRIALGEVPISGIIDKYKINAFFLLKSFHKAMIQRMQNIDGLKPSYEDSECIIFLVPGASK